jgi:hypothetical protein
MIQPAEKLLISVMSDAKNRQEAKERPIKNTGQGHR